MLTTIAQDAVTSQGAGIGDRRDQHLERRGGVYAAGFYQCTGVYGGDEAWVSDHRDCAKG